MPIITLTTDFGGADHFTGAMKGVILSIAPTARIVDLSHEIPAYSISEGAFVIAESYRYFPKKTVHVAVVDPGVGSTRRPLLVEAGGQIFVGPDNGIFGLIYAREERVKVREITNRRYTRKDPSATFHGRDVFAPAAAHLARGVRPAAFGPLIQDYLRPRLEKPLRTGHRVWTGTVLKVDRFGNLITNFHISDFPSIAERPFVMIAGVSRVETFVKTFSDCPMGELAVLAGSSGYLEVVSNQGSAARLLGCGAGSPVELSLY
jgi:hypothetical protein